MYAPISLVAAVGRARENGRFDGTGAVRTPLDFPGDRGVTLWRGSDTGFDGCSEPHEQPLRAGLRGYLNPCPPTTHVLISPSSAGGVGDPILTL